MSELDKITTQVSPSITNIKTDTPVASLDDTFKTVSLYLNLNIEESLKFKEILNVEKNKNSSAFIILLETIVLYLDKNVINTSDKDQEALFIQNKKIVKDLLFNVMQLFKNYKIDEREIKITLLGKLIQSLHDGKR